ncbi:MAG: type II toxin-antitoxin system VapC family toxin [Myxococcaceae bacterium]|nr:type II toxin-antitoxin system VapC family toxin [Myxococcaceae bacterium]
MSLYVDSSALLKRYVDETDSDACERQLAADTTWVSGRHGYVEIHRNLARLLAEDALLAAQSDFENDWKRFAVIEIDEVVCERSANIAKATGARTLDALHLGAASRLGGPSAVAMLTYDVRLAIIARQLGYHVLGI